MKKYVLALDQGTTSSRAIIFDKEQNIVAKASRELTSIYPKEGYVEQDAMEIYSSQYGVMMEVLAKSGISADEISAIGIANQRETTIIWDKVTGMPIYNAIVWQCRRTADICDDLTQRGLSEYVKDTTGLVIDAYFSATKIKWILDNVDGAREKANRGELAFGTVDSFLLYKLTYGKVHSTDYTNASRTMLFDIKKLCWDDTLLKELDIPKNMLPNVFESSHIFGETSINGVNIPISGIAGDQQAALFGQKCFGKGMAKNTYGTGCFLLINTGETLLKSDYGLLSTIAATADGSIKYALEGSVFIGGAVIQWLRDEMRLITESRDAEYFSTKVSDTGGVYLVPAFTGLGAPHWDMFARGTIVGITRGTKREHIIRAAEESIAFQCYDLIHAAENDLGEKITEFFVDGGACRDGFLMQFQSDVLNSKIILPNITETTAQGAAFLAGLATSFWDINTLSDINSVKNVFTPNMPEAKRQKLINGWNKALGRSLNWEKD